MEAIFVTLGLVHFKIGKMGDARDFFSKGERLLQDEYIRNIADPALKNKLLSQLKKAFELHLEAAEADKAEKEVVEIKKRLAVLPR